MLDKIKAEIAKEVEKHYEEWQFVAGLMTAKDIFEKYAEPTTIEKIRAEIEQNAYPIVHGVNNHEKGMTLYGILQIIDKYAEQEPISVSVSEKEPDEISEEVTLRFFRNSLKVRWQDMVIYNVEWLKKNWQMEMDIVCGVKPCGDVVSRQAVNTLVDELARAISDERCCMSRGRSTATIMQDILELPSVRPQELTKEEQALLQKWRDNRGISIEDFEDAMNALQEQDRESEG